MAPDGRPVHGGSDLSLVPFMALLVLAVVAILAAFFFVGVVVGFIVLVVCVVAGGAIFARFIRRNELN
ncbi:MAG: hypothetical protein ACRDPE_14335 [Solirubrobacterales bacterium]